MMKSSLYILVFLLCGIAHLPAAFEPLPGDPGNRRILGLGYCAGSYFAYFQGTSLLRSTDGYQWTTAPQQPVGSYSQMATYGDTLILIGQSTLAVTRDGQNWQESTINNLGTRGYILDAGYDGSSFYAASPNGVHKSIDGGVTWTLVAPFEGNTFGSGNARPARMAVSGGNVIVVGDGGIAVSTDGGATFTQKDDGQPIIGTYHLGVTKNAVYALAQIHLYKSTNHGVTWTKVYSEGNAMEMSVDPHGGVYLRNNDGLLKSANGRDWKQVLSFKELGWISNFYPEAAGEIVLYSYSAGTLVARAADLRGGGEPVFRTSTDYSNNWSQSPWFGFYYNEHYPIVYSAHHGWVWVEGPSEESFFGYDFDFGWFYTSNVFYPFLYVFKNASWYYYDVSSPAPAGYVKFPENILVAEHEVGQVPEPAEFVFANLAGHTIVLTDSLGAHRISFNQLTDPTNDGADLFFQLNGKTYKMSTVTVAYTEQLDGPQILIQAVSGVGDTALGSSVQINLKFTKQFSGTHAHIGYAIFDGVPKLGGAGISGTFAHE